jgi:hypothetical protein
MFRDALRFCVLLLGGLIVTGSASPLDAATFRLRDGQALEGRIFSASSKGVIIRQESGPLSRRFTYSDFESLDYEGAQKIVKRQQIEDILAKNAKKSTQPKSAPDGSMLRIGDSETKSAKKGVVAGTDSIELSLGSGVIINVDAEGMTLKNGSRILPKLSWDLLSEEDIQAALESHAVSNELNVFESRASNSKSAVKISSLLSRLWYMEEESQVRIADRMQLMGVFKRYNQSVTLLSQSESNAAAADANTLNSIGDAVDAILDIPNDIDSVSYRKYLTTKAKADEAIDKVGTKVQTSNRKYDTKLRMRQNTARLARDLKELGFNINTSGPYPLIPAFNVREYEAAFEELRQEQAATERKKLGNELTSSALKRMANLFGGGKTATSLKFTQGLMGYYPFSGDSQDRSGNENHAGGRGSLSVDRFGNPSSCFALNGSSEYLLIPKSSSLSSGADLTVSAWIFLNRGADAPPNNFCIAAKGLDRQDPMDWAINITGNRIRSHVMVGSAWTFSDSTARIPIREWTHVATTYGGGWLRNFINGDLSSELRKVGSKINTPTAMRIGAYAPVNGRSGSAASRRSRMRIGAYAPVNGTVSKSFFNGKIDDVRIYKRALAPSEVEALYEFERSN